MRTITSATNRIDDFLSPTVMDRMFHDKDSNLEKVSGRWMLDLNMIDINMGRSLSFDCNFCFRHLVGLRIACCDQVLNLKEEGQILKGSFPDQVFHANYEFKEKLYHDFLGVGPRIGGGSLFELGCGFSLYGEVAGSFLYGEDEGRSRQKGRRFNSVEPVIDSDDFRETIDKSKWCTHLVSDLKVGLSWVLLF